MDRRTFLLASAAALAGGGCTPGVDPGPEPTAPATPEDPDAALRADVVRSERALIAAYAAAIETAPQLAEVLAPLTAHHSEHLARVAGGAESSLVPESRESWSATGPAQESATGPAQESAAGPAQGSMASRSPAATGSPDRAATESAQPTPVTRGVAVLTALRKAEERAQDERGTACDEAIDPELARTLALVCACEAQHVIVIGRLLQDAEASGS